jgi:hypothetical protein
MGNITSTAVNLNAAITGAEADAALFHLKVLGIEEAYETMQLNEQTDNYRVTCRASPPNALAISRYIQAPIMPPQGATALSNAAFAEVPPTLKPTGTVKVGFIENGLPHTRPPATIWFPGYMIKEKSFSATFLHECIHLHQRSNKKKWNDFYRNFWQFEPYNGSIPKEIEERRRINPDTMRQPFYIWRGQWIPVLVFERPGAADLKSCKLLWVEPSGAWQQHAPPDWELFFGTVNGSICEHPHEMAAYFLSDNENPFDSQAANILRKEFLLH